MVLRAIQNRLENDLGKIASKWYGTSTGSVISAALLVQDKTDFLIAVQNVLDIYEFRSASLINPFGVGHPERALHKILEENFGFLSLSDMPKIHVVACKKPDYSTTVFNAENDINLAEALKASCAVPGLFKSININGTYYVDGFIKAKNPSLLALESHELNDNLILLSLGTGILREVDSIEMQVRETHKVCEDLAAKKGFHYFRFNPRLVEAADDMQDTRLKNIFGLKKDCENYLLEKKDRLEALINLLREL